MWNLDKKTLLSYNTKYSSIVLKLKSQIKHTLHCCLLFAIISYFQIAIGAKKLTSENEKIINPWESYGYIWTICLYFLRYLPLLALPKITFSFLGLVLFNAFPDKVQLKESPLLAPFVCFRIVTRGDYPDLVRSNVVKNLRVCSDTGIENFMIEVVTNKTVKLRKHPKVREVVVPSTYATKSGALYKARALQYCLEDDVNILNDSDWIVHLDEETLLTADSVRGILNFACDGKHQFGQGMITYGAGVVVNWVTTLADSFRVAEDMGVIRCQFNLFHRPLFSWKGSYVVTQVGAERAVSFDNGLDGSVAEDCFFSMVAYREGYSFAFIDGEMHEKSPFTVFDFLQQRKRWIQGFQLVVNSNKIALRYKFFLTMGWLVWITLPLISCNIFLTPLFSLPPVPLFDIPLAFGYAVAMYMQIFGALKMFSPARLGKAKFLLCILGSVLVLPFNMVTENIAVGWALIGNKYNYYVVKKELKDM